MEYVKIEQKGEIAQVTLSRGKVNALNPEVVRELRGTFSELAASASVRATILTGAGPFFSFGFDIPEFLGYTRAAFTDYLRNFTALYRELYVHPKPILAALNGHTVAGGCMIATVCDHRIMVTGKAKIGLNEVTFGASVFAGSVDILRHLTGQKNAERILLSGSLYSAEEATSLGLVDQVCEPDQLASSALETAGQFAAPDPVAFASIKRLLRMPIAERMKESEADSIREFIDIWYSAQTREQLEKIKIRS